MTSGAASSLLAAVRRSLQSLENIWQYRRRRPQMNVIKITGVGRPLQSHKDRSRGGATLLKHGHKAGHGLHGPGCTDGQKYLAPLQFLLHAFHFVRLLAKPADVRTLQGTAGTSRQTAGRIFVEVRKGGKATAISAAAFKQFTVDMKDVPRAGGFVEPVHILRAQEADARRPGLLKLRQGQVRGVRLGITRTSPAFGIIIPDDCRIGVPGINAGQFVMSAPSPVRSLEDGDTAFRADARAGKNKDVARLPHWLRARFALLYNHHINLRTPASIVLCLLLLATVAASPVSLAAQSEPRLSEMVLIMPFENASGAAGTDWISESFPEVLGTRLDTGTLFVFSRDDRHSAFDHLGIPASAKPSRATVYQIAEALDADYVVVGSYRVEAGTLTARAQVMDVNNLRLGPELSEAGQLEDLVALENALAWDVLDNLKRTRGAPKAQYVSQFPAIRKDALENYIRGILAGSEKEKIARLQEAVRLDPGYTLALLQLGKAYYKAPDYTSAMTWLSKVPGNKPHGNEAQFYLGLSAFYAGQMEPAYNAFAALASRMPLTEVSNNLGVVAARRGDRRARTYFEKTVQIDPTDPDYHFNLAVELFREGASQDAARELRRVLAAHPDPEARSLLDAIAAGAAPARLPLERIKLNYDESGFRQLALEIDNANELRLEKADAPTHAAFHVQRGDDMLEQGFLEEAEKQFREAVLLASSNAAAHAGLARVLEGGQDYAGARSEAQMSIQLQPSADAYLVLARVDVAENDMAAAERNVSRALQIDPGNAAAAALKHDIAAGLAKPKPR